MTVLKERNKKYALTACAVAASWVLAGCGKSEGGSSTTSAAGADATLIAAGKVAFDANGCTRCHALNGKGGGMGPDLSHTGAEASHTPEWLTAHVKNPKTHNPGSRMPAFEGQINDKDLTALGVYLASLK